MTGTADRVRRAHRIAVVAHWTLMLGLLALVTGLFVGEVLDLPIGPTLPIGLLLAVGGGIVYGGTKQLADRHAEVLPGRRVAEIATDMVSPADRLQIGMFADGSPAHMVEPHEPSRRQMAQRHLPAAIGEAHRLVAVYGPDDAFTALTEVLEEVAEPHEVAALAAITLLTLADPDGEQVSIVRAAVALAASRTASLDG